MYHSRTPMPRLLRYNDPGFKGDGAGALRREIAKFVGGIKGDRKNPVSEKQILAWFKSTDPDFVRKQITDACGAGEIRCVRTSTRTRGHNRAYRYEV